MARTRAKKVRVEEPELHNDERWMASYMDMVTVLMCLFIVLFAMSSVDAAKFEQLKNSLATGFGTTEEGKIDTAEGIVVPADKVGEEGESFTDSELAVQEIANLRSIQKRIDDGLAVKGLSKTVNYTINERGLTVALIDSGSFFAANSSTLSGQARQVLAVIGGVLSTTSHEISVEGHTDSRRPEAYASNWELSSDRATKVVRFFAESGGINAARLGAIGFGQARPSKSESTAAGMAANRRADVVVLSDKPESVRALIPELIAHPEKATPAKKSTEKSSTKKETGGH